jgi:PAS domain S-box-containing protein
MATSNSPSAAWLDAVFDPYIAADGQGIILEWNRPAAALFGWSRDEVIGRPVDGLLIPVRHLARYEDALRCYRESGSRDFLKRRHLMSLLTKEGAEVPVEIALWTQPGGAGTQFGALLREVQMRNDAIALSELHGAVVRSSQDAIITKTLQGIVTSWNPAAEKVLGYTAEEAIGRSILMLIPDDRKSEEIDILARLRRGERIEQYETVRKTKDGRLLHVSLMISPVRGADGTIIGASKILRDMTERRRLEEALRAETAMLETLNQVGQKLASNLELEPLLQAVTDAGTRLTGAEFGAFFFSAVDDRGGRCHLVTLSGRGKEIFQELRPPRPTPLFPSTSDGTAAVIRLDDVQADPEHAQWTPQFGTAEQPLPIRSYLAVPVLSRRGAVEGGLFFGHSLPGMFNERAERLIRGLAPHAAVAIDNARMFEERERLLNSERNARAELERASVSKDEFIATLSHELRTPLNAILGWATVLERSPDNPETVAKGVEIIKRNTHAQTQLVDDLLDMSRIIAGQMRPDFQAIMPMPFIEAAVEALRPTAEARELRLEIMLDPRAGPINGDPGRLQQVAWNLVSNAIKFTPQGGRVQVSLERVNSHIEINVADTGIGIEPEFLPHLFERYRQADSSMTRKHRGLGLGLAIAKHIVERHGGRIEAKSPGSGQGSTFRVQLPLAVVHRNGEAGSRQHPASGGQGCADPAVDLTGLSVLIVDDEPEACDFLVSVFQSCGAEVLAARSGEEALAIVREHQPSVIVSDIGMPEMDGYELLRRIRQLETGQDRRIPAIALTAFARSEDRTRSLLSGYIAHLAKPVEASEIVAMVASMAGRTG